MNEQTERPMSEEPSVAPATPSVPPASAPARIAAKADPMPWLYGGGFLILLLGLVFVWLNPNLPPSLAAAAPAIQSADQRIAVLDSRLKQLEARPVPPPAATPSDVVKLATRLDILETRDKADPAQVAQRLDVMAGRIEGMTGRLQTSIDTEKQDIETLSARITVLEKAANSGAAIAARLDRVARLDDAAMKLASGKPIGDLPNAPPALAKFAKVAPPTQAQLRLTFPQAEDAALAAEQPNLKNAPLVDRAWEKMQALVTIRRGDAVVVGNMSAVILGAARTSLDAGDLAGAVDALGHLADAPKQAMAKWIADAKALLDARAALVSMAGQV